MGHLSLPKYATGKDGQPDKAQPLVWKPTVFRAALRQQGGLRSGRNRGWNSRGKPTPPAPLRNDDGQFVYEPPTARQLRNAARRAQP